MEFFKLFLAILKVLNKGVLYEIHQETMSKQMCDPVLYFYVLSDNKNSNMSCCWINVWAWVLPCPPGQPCALSNGAAVFRWTRWAADPQCLTNACCAPHSFSLSDEPDENWRGESHHHIFSLTLTLLGVFTELIKLLCMDIRILYQWCVSQTPSLTWWLKRVKTPSWKEWCSVCIQQWLLN